MQAEAVILRSFSSCAEALPTEIEVWDVSNFVYASSNKPFSRQPVRTWLNCVYSALNNPATELVRQDVKRLSTAGTLHEPASAGRHPAHIHILVIFWSTTTPEGLLTGFLDHVFTEPVLQAAVGGSRSTNSSSSSNKQRQAYMNSVLTRPCSFAPGDPYSLLKPTGPITSTPDGVRQEFKAAFLRDFAGLKAGDPVKVSLRLFYEVCGVTCRPGMYLEYFDREAGMHTCLDFPVQLLLGTPR